MKKRRLTACMLLMTIFLSACASEEQNQQQEKTQSTPNQEVQEHPTETMPSSDFEKESEDITTGENLAAEEVATSLAEEAEDSHILIAYFTRLDNTDADLDTIVQGGGPYGEIGNSYAEADIDAISSASITIQDGEAKGNTQVVAETIQELTDADLFSIQTVQSYPTDYDELIDLGGEERSAKARPELVTQVENMQQYDVIFIGFPNWWYDMPMALYSFLESYDLSGKTIIPFATSASSGFSNAIATIKELQPNALVEENGLHIPMREVADSKNRIEEWITQLALLENAE